MTLSYELLVFELGDVWHDTINTYAHSCISLKRLPIRCLKLLVYKALSCISLKRLPIRCLISLTPHGKGRAEGERRSDWDILKRDEEMERGKEGGGGVTDLGGGYREWGRSEAVGGGADEGVLAIVRPLLKVCV